MEYGKGMMYPSQVLLSCLRICETSFAVIAVLLQGGLWIEVIFAPVERIGYH